MAPQPSIRVARTFWQRFVGLMLSRPLPPTQALLIPRCASVHTFFMRYALDLVYLDARGVIVKLAPQVKPWRLSWGGRAAVHTLEMSAGGIQGFGLKVGDAVALPPDMEKNDAQHL